MSTLVADLLARADPAEISMRAGITPDPGQERRKLPTSPLWRAGLPIECGLDPG
jgi:hypothetical protein